MTTFDEPPTTQAIAPTADLKVTIPDEPGEAIAQAAGLEVTTPTS